MIPDYYRPRPLRIGGCFTCRYAGAPLSDFSNAVAHRTITYHRPNTWSATLSENSCRGWDRKPGSDDEIRQRCDQMSTFARTRDEFAGAIERDSGIAVAGIDAI